MTRVELKKWAKEKIKGHTLELLVAIIITNFLITLSLSIPTGFSSNDGKIDNLVFHIGFLFTFVEAGLAYYMLNFINDKPHTIKDLFRYSNDFTRDLVVGILRDIFIVLWALLFIVPGIIKAYGYSLVGLLLADEKYKDLSYMDTLKKSEELMNGHKMDLFIFDLSFIGWHILAIFTLFLLEIWISPYYTTAKYKFLEDIKNSSI